MYGATLPTYESKKDKEERKRAAQDTIKADDPANRERVRELIKSFE